ncbi:MAG TPA: oligoendopeptidase F [Paenibacillaceae bacterium]|nr:oligoendopeptidase F [Paenibacillaceae bacterium]
MLNIHIKITSYFLCLILVMNVMSPMVVAAAENQDKWDLSRLYPSEEQWKKDIKKIEKKIPYFQSMKGKITSSPSAFYEFLIQYEETSKLVEKAYGYAHMQFDTNTTDSHYQEVMDQARQISQKLNVTTSFVVPEILAIDDKNLEQMMSKQKNLEKYRKFLTQIRKQKKHILSESEEKLLAGIGDVSSVPSRTYQYLVDSDLQFPKITIGKGQVVQLTASNYRSLLEDLSPYARKQAYMAVTGTYGQYKNTFASLLQGEVKNNIFYAQARNYQSARNASLSSSNIPEKVYDDLLTTVNKRISLLHRYTALRKKVLGLKELHKYDIYVPLTSQLKIQYPFTMAKEMVVKGLGPLGNDYTSMLSSAFKNRWIDVYSQKGKTSGAYQTAVYGYPPYVLLNYQSNLDDVLTLAHEMGHAMHSYYANQNQSYLNAGYDIFVAEVASTVNESLLLRQWIDQAKSKEEKLTLLNHYLDQFQNTLFIQTMFAEFEKEIYGAGEKGVPLTAEYISQVYSNLVKKYFGPSMVVDPEVGIEWARIPHFFRSFYVYQYATGFSAATSIADGLLKKKEGQQAKYLEFLKTGGAKDSLDALKIAGVDLSNPAVVSSALDVFEKTLNEYEKLVQ